MPVRRTDNLAWRKSSYSGGASGNCVEVAVLPATTALRDSKDPDGGIIELRQAAWSALRKSITY